MCRLIVGSEKSLLLRVLVWFRFDMSGMVLSGSGVWVGFIIPLGMFIRSDVSMGFVMRWLAVWGSSWREVFLRVCSMCLVNWGKLAFL